LLEQYTNLKIHFALSEQMIPSFKKECSNQLNPGLIPKINIIELADKSSCVEKIYDEDVEEVIQRLGGTGDVLLLIDYDNLEFRDEASVKKLLEHLDTFSSKLLKENCRIEKNLCMNESSLNNHFAKKPALRTAFACRNYQSKHIFSLNF
jgi:hypothetical protein